MCIRDRFSDISLCGRLSDCFENSQCRNCLTVLIDHTVQKPPYCFDTPHCAETAIPFRYTSSCRNCHNVLDISHCAETARLFSRYLVLQRQSDCFRYVSIVQRMPDCFQCTDHAKTVIPFLRHHVAQKLSNCFQRIDCAETTSLLSMLCHASILNSQNMSPIQTA